MQSSGLLMSLGGVNKCKKMKYVKGKSVIVAVIRGNYHGINSCQAIHLSYLCLRSVTKRRCTSIVSFKNWFYAEQNNFHGAAEQSARRFGIDSEEIGAGGKSSGACGFVGRKYFHDQKGLHFSGGVHIYRGLRQHPKFICK